MIRHSSTFYSVSPTIFYIPQYDLICIPNLWFSTIANFIFINVYSHFDPTAKLNRNFSQEVNQPIFYLLRLAKLRTQFCLISKLPDSIWFSSSWSLKMILNSQQKKLNVCNIASAEFDFYLMLILSYRYTIF